MQQDIRKKGSCNSCIYLGKRAGAGNYFIYHCVYWGLVTHRILPQSVIIQSIGRTCPFYKRKTKNKTKNKNESKDDNGLDIVI